MAASANAFEFLRPSHITVTAFGSSWALADGMAYDWVGAVTLDPDDLSGIFPGMALDADLDALWEHSQAGDFGKRCTLAARAALGRAAGKDWWWALNLVKKIMSAWPVINGIMLRENVNSQQAGLADFLDAVYSLLWERSKDEDRMRLDIELAMLPAGIRVRQSPEAKKAMLAAFAAE